MKKNDVFASSTLDQLKQEKNGVEFWSARELQALFWYKRWQSFKSLVYKTEKILKTLGEETDLHITHVTKVRELQAWWQRAYKDYDFLLTRFACYILAQNWSSKIDEIVHAQAYFAQQARKQELREEYIENRERIKIREEITKQQKVLMRTAKESWVFHYGTFNDEGYKGLYWMRAREIKKHKWLWKDSIYDRASVTELAANLFRITQTNEKLKIDEIKSQKDSEKTHYIVWGKIRETIKEIWWKMPEELAPVEHIKKTEEKVRKSKKRLQ